MYWENKYLGLFNVQRLRYQEERMEDFRQGYKLGFRIALLPSLEVSNSSNAVMVLLRFIAWQMVWYRQKVQYIDYDINGNAAIKTRGVRYFLSLRWLFKST